jgi:hypothetical protein
MVYVELKLECKVD